MNTQKINFQESFQQNHVEFANPESQYFGIHHQQPWNMRSRRTPPPMEEEEEQQQPLDPVRSSSTILGRFGSPASAFYATERFMGFSQYECQAGNPSCSSDISRVSDSQQFHSYQSPGENYSIVSADQAESLEIPWKFYKSPETSFRNPCSSPLLGRPFSAPFDENQDHRVHIFSPGNFSFSLLVNSSWEFILFQG